MRVLLLHNHYGNYAVGGEAMVVRAEAELLRAKGHEVSLYERTNEELIRRGIWGMIRAVTQVTWSKQSLREVGAVLDEFVPDVVHVHNYKFVLTPSVFKAAKDRGIATCLTLHNYRLACPAGQFLRRGKPCEDCLDGYAVRMLWNACASTNPVKNAVQYHLYRGTRRRQLLLPWVDVYIALTQFAKSRFVAAGIPSEKISVKPNFTSDIGFDGIGEPEAGALFVGRLSREKGVAELLEAWREIDYPLSIVGDGPLMPKLRRNAPDHVTFHGALRREACCDLMKRSTFLVFPSVWYEGFPITLLESFSIGIPCVASDLGPRCEMVHDGYNGLLYPSGDIAKLRSKIRLLIADRDLCKRMGRNARELYLGRYTPENNYGQLVSIYDRAIRRSHCSLLA